MVTLLLNASWNEQNRDLSICLAICSNPESIEIYGLFADTLLSFHFEFVFNILKSLEQTVVITYSFQQI